MAAGPPCLIQVPLPPPGRAQPSPLSKPQAAFTGIFAYLKPTLAFYNLDSWETGPESSPNVLERSIYLGNPLPSCVGGATGEYVVLRQGSCVSERGL